MKSSYSDTPSEILLHAVLVSSGQFGFKLTYEGQKMSDVVVDFLKFCFLSFSWHNWNLIAENWLPDQESW